MTYLFILFFSELTIIESHTYRLIEKKMMPTRIIQTEAKYIFNITYQL